MNWADFTNGLFEAGTGLAACHSCYRLYCDKKVAGLSHYLMWWVTLWGYWNLYYYPSLNQWLSFTGGIVIVTANTVWIGMSVYYYRRGKRLAMNPHMFWEGSPWTVDRDGRCSTDKERRKVIVKAKT